MPSGDLSVDLSCQRREHDRQLFRRAVEAGLGLGAVSIHTPELELETGRLAILDVQDFPIMHRWYLIQRKGGAFRRLRSRSVHSCSSRPGRSSACGRTTSRLQGGQAVVIETIYEDDYLVAVNKPFNMLSVPGRGEDKQDSVASRLQQLYSDIRVVHRLDCHTSGLMLLARGLDMQRRLSRLFHDRQVHKRYVALVEGAVEQQQGLVDIPLRGDPDNRPVQVVDYLNGRPAQTRWRLQEIREDPSGVHTSRLLLFPVTGRTHQLRVHCMAMGHPIVGDRLYNGAGERSPRMMLHAERLEFIHPVSKEMLRLVAECEF